MRSEYGVGVGGMRSMVFMLFMLVTRTGCEAGRDRAPMMRPPQRVGNRSTASRQHVTDDTAVDVGQPCVHTRTTLACLASLGRLGFSNGGVSCTD